MKKIIPALALVLGALTATPCLADRPALIMHRLLQEFGFFPLGTYDTRPGHEARMFVSSGTVAGYEVDYRGSLTSAMVTIINPRDESAYKALAAGYAAVQDSMGKVGPLVENPMVLARKGLLLLDAIIHNLKRLDQTVFPFDDMMVSARKNQENRYIMIILMPRWRP